MLRLSCGCQRPLHTKKRGTFGAKTRGISKIQFDFHTIVTREDTSLPHNYLQLLLLATVSYLPTYVVHTQQHIQPIKGDLAAKAEI